MLISRNLHKKNCEVSITNKVTSSLIFIQGPGNLAHNCEMVYCALFEGSEIILRLLVQRCLLVTLMKTSICLTHAQGRCLTLKRLPNIL